jgi:hypothetical protein
VVNYVSDQDNKDNWTPGVSPTYKDDEHHAAVESLFPLIFPLHLGSGVVSRRSFPSNRLKNSWSRLFGCYRVLTSIGNYVFLGLTYLGDILQSLSYRHSGCLQNGTQGSCLSCRLPLATVVPSFTV